MSRLPNMRFNLRQLLLSLSPILFLFASPVKAEELPAAVQTEDTQETASVQSVIPMRLTAIHGGQFAYIQALERMATTIENQSQGRIKVTLLLGGEAGSEVEALKGQIHNRIEGGMTSAATLAFSLPAFRLLTLPLLFTEPNHVKQFVHSSLDSAIRETAQDKQLRVLGYGSYGFYGLLAFQKKEIDPPANPLALSPEPNTPNDGLNAQALPSYVNLAVRAPRDQWIENIHRALPIKLVQVPVADLPEAIESGWVEGIVSTPETLSNTRYPFTASHYHDLRQQHGWSVFTVNADWFSGLPTDLQSIVERAADLATKQMLTAAFNQEYRVRNQWLAANWPRVVIPEPAELEAAFRPLSFRTIHKLERLLNTPKAIARLWDANQKPRSELWTAPDQLPIWNEIPAADQDPSPHDNNLTDQEIQELMMKNDLNPTNATPAKL
ncbi:MAG: TRAP transporter substrate-binding protein DctP [Magnetococcales bacterium]|nr:TRAP transporter substrate-binding protein DctP [Magnetococcales bacterium]